MGLCVVCGDRGGGGALGGGGGGGVYKHKSKRVNNLPSIHGSSNFRILGT